MALIYALAAVKRNPEHASPALDVRERCCR
jgi:hypothetical protein